MDKTDIESFFNDDSKQEQVNQPNEENLTQNILTGNTYWDKMTAIHNKTCSKIKKDGYSI